MSESEYSKVSPSTMYIKLSVPLIEFECLNQWHWTYVLQYPVSLVLIWVCVCQLTKVFHDISCVSISFVWPSSLQVKTDMTLCCDCLPWITVHRVTSKYKFLMWLLQEPLWATVSASHRTTMWLSNSTPGCLSKESKNTTSKDMGTLMLTSGYFQ